MAVAVNKYKLGWGMPHGLLTPEMRNGFCFRRSHSDIGVRWRLLYGQSLGGRGYCEFMGEEYQERLYRDNLAMMSRRPLILPAYLHGYFMILGLRSLQSGKSGLERKGWSVIGA